MSEALKQPDASIFKITFFLKESGFVTFVNTLPYTIRLWLVLYSSKLVILGCFYGLHRHPHSYSRTVGGVSSKHKLEMYLRTHSWSKANTAKKYR